MRTRMMSLGAILLSGAVVFGGAAGVAQAHPNAAAVTITVAYERQGPPPFNDDIMWQRVAQQLKTIDPNITLKLLPVVASEGDYYTKIDLMMKAANTAPDIVREDSFLVSQDVTAGFLRPLDKYLAAWPEYAQQWFPSMQQITLFNGHNYGIMNGTDDRLIWYNKHVFQKAGLPLNWQPHSWADILKAARTIKAKVPGVVPMNCYSGIPEDEASTMQCFEMLLYGTPGSQHLYDYKTKKWIVSGKGLEDTLNFIKTIYDPTNLLAPTNDIALNSAGWAPIHNDLLPNDKMGINIDGSWVSSTWYPTGSHPWPQWKKVMGNAEMPTQFGQAPKYVTLSGGWANSISAKSPHPDQAFEVLKVFNSQANLDWYDTQIGNITPRKDVVDAPSYSKVPLNSFYTGMLSFSQFRPGFPAYPRISNQIDLAMENVMSGMSPKDAAAGFTQAVTGIAGSGNVEAGM